MGRITQIIIQGSLLIFDLIETLKRPSKALLYYLNFVLVRKWTRFKGNTSVLLVLLVCLDMVTFWRRNNYGLGVGCGFQFVYEGSVTWMVRYFFGRWGRVTSSDFKVVDSWECENCSPDENSLTLTHAEKRSQNNYWERSIHNPALHEYMYHLLNFSANNKLSIRFTFLSMCVIVCSKNEFSI